MWVTLCRRFPTLPWYAGKFGLTVRMGRAHITMPSRYLAGLLRLRSYEQAELAAVRWLSRHRPVIECGGGAGVIACAIAAHLAPGTPHVVVEANPVALACLHHNKAQNHASFTVVDGAIATTDTVTFAPDSGIVSGHVGGPLTVRGWTLRALLDAHAIAGPISIVCDIEGAEVDLLTGDLPPIETLILERHPHLIGAEADAALHARLLRHGLVVRWRRDDVWVYQAN